MLSQQYSTILNEKVVFEFQWKLEQSTSNILYINCIKQIKEEGVMGGTFSSFYSMEDQYPNLSEDKIVDLISQSELKLDNSQFIGWILRMVPAIASSNPIVIVAAVLSGFNILKYSQKDINIELVKEEVDLIKDKIDMVQLHPQKLEWGIEEINFIVKNRFYRLKQLGKDRGEMTFLVSMFLFLRGLKTLPQKINQKLDKIAEENLLNLKILIVKKRMELIKPTQNIYQVTTYSDFFYGGNFLTVAKIMVQDIENYQAKVTKAYEEYLKIKRLA